VPSDVSDPGQVARLFARVQAEFGGLDLLFNNAGVGYHGRFETSDPAEWERMIGANLSGVLHCTHQAIGLMRNREGAMISSVASVLGRHGMEGWSVYTATKYAVVGFHEALRKELGGEGIRVSLIEPGAVYTAWGHNVPPERMKERRDKLEALQAEDIARTLVFGFAQPANVNVQELLVMPTRQTTP
jgi:NADP-dependent 3-hydroxy acid dehydrogenase YdfG